MDSSYSQPPVDSAHPFKGVVVCCTSIPPDQRTEIAKKTEELGGAHKYDLTPDVTHLVVGDYDTPKYRHVSKERTDIKAMDARWIDAVGQLWMEDADIDFAALEKQWQLKPLETCGEVIDGANSTHTKRGSLLLCMTGFDDPDLRNTIIERIQANGGTYTGDLTKRVSHLLVHKPEGRKYKAARAWNIRTVSLAWLDQSIERGMILDENCFDPVLPPSEQGEGAWNRVNPRRVSLGKRSRSGVDENGQRKLRKTASMKLSSQRDTLWGDILGSKPSGDSPTPADKIEVQDSGVHDVMAQPVPDAGIFSACYFFMAGFESWKSKILSETIGSLGGRTCDSFSEVVETRTRPARRFLIVPQESEPANHFRVPPADTDKVTIVTEFFIERCIHNKTLCDPDAHVLGRPFPKFPILGFEDLSVCTAGFTGIDLLHVEKGISQVGAKFSAWLNEATSILVCKSLAETRKEKLKFAFENDIPIVSSEWLWDSITTGYNVPVASFMFPELKQNPNLRPKPRQKEPSKTDTKQPIQRTRSEPIPIMPKKPTSKHPSVTGLDHTAFHNDKGPAESKQTATKVDSTTSFQFHTAKTHQMDSFGGGTVTAPLANASLKERNKSPARTARPLLKERTSVADSLEPTPTSVVPEESQYMVMAEQEVGVPREPERESEGVADDHHPDKIGEEAAGLQLEPDSKPMKLGHPSDPITIDRVSANNLTTTKEGTVKTPIDPEEKARERAEKEKEAQRKAEKEVLSSKLTSLMEYTTGASNSADANVNASVDSANKEEASGQQHRRPKRRIFGRAISNASAASSGSTESRVPFDEREQQQQPPSTQLQWQDPGAQHHQAKIKSLLGEEVPDVPAVNQAKIKLGGFEFDDDDDDGSSGRALRRQPRRRG